MDRRRIALVAALAAGVVVVVATAAAVALRAREPGGPQAAASPFAEAPDVTATAEIRRTVHQARVVTIAVHNHGPEPVRVRQAELVVESFDPAGAVEVDVLVPPGLVRDVVVGYGPGRCDEPAALVAGPARARLDIVTIDGQPHPLEVALPHPNGVLDRLLRDDCTTQVVERAVRLRLGAWSDLDDGRLEVILRLERLDGDAPIILYDVAGSVLFTMSAEATRPVAELAAGRDQIEVPVIMDAARCDLHAIGDSNRRYSFPAWVTVGVPERLHTIIEVDPAHRDALNQMQTRRCG